MSHAVPQKVALVDPIRSGKGFISELERRNVEFVLVESGLAGDVSDGKHVPVRAPAVELMAREARRLGVTQVVACVDPSTMYADELCAQLGVPFSGLRMSKARRDKARMNEAVRGAGLRAPAQFETADAGELSAWLASAAYPVVVKPAASGGTDNVHLCTSADEAMACFQKILHARNLMGGHNATVLIQEYIDGVEYVVDCVSFASVHVPVDMFQYQKGVHNGRAFVYEKQFFLRSDDERAGKLLSFAKRVLDTLEFRVGASHMEVKIDPKGDVVFIEVGARVGGDPHRLVRDTRADGKCQVEIALDAALGVAPPAAEYETARDGLRRYIVSTQQGRLTGFRHTAEIERMSSFQRMSLHVEVGKDVVKTTDLSNTAGTIDLAHSDSAILRADEARLDAILKAGFLVVE